MTGKSFGEQLEAYGNPLTNTAGRLVNVVNGCIANDQVNVANAISIGQRMAADFEESLLDAFHKPVYGRVCTMEIMQKGMKVGDQTIYNMEKLYGRLLVISMKRNRPLEYVFGYELAPLPSSLFDEYGLMRKASKSTLIAKSKLFVVGDDNVPIDIQLLMAINSSTTRLGQRWALHWLFVKIWQKLQKKIIQCMFFFTNTTRTPSNHRNGKEEHRELHILTISYQSTLLCKQGTQS